MRWWDRLSICKIKIWWICSIWWWWHSRIKANNITAVIAPPIIRIQELCMFLIHQEVEISHINPIINKCRIDNHPTENKPNTRSIKLRVSLVLFLVKTIIFKRLESSESVLLQYPFTFYFLSLRTDLQKRDFSYTHKNTSKLENLTIRLWSPWHQTTSLR
jgi:hypothetical protein